MMLNEELYVKYQIRIDVNLLESENIMIEEQLFEHRSSIERSELESEMIMIES
jgi:hypothetical protein